MGVYTEIVLTNIKFCADKVTVDKCIQIFPNQKPWLTREVCTLLRDHNTTFRAANRALYSIARAKMKRGIREANRVYKKKIEDYLFGNDPRHTDYHEFQGVQYYCGE